MKNTMRSLSLAALFAIAFVTTASESQVSAENLFTVGGTGNSYQIVDSSNPTVVTQSGTISGIDAGENILGLDFRANGGGIWAITDANLIYQIDTTNFAATSVGPVLNPTLTSAGESFGFDFNPNAAGGVLFRTIAGDTQNNRVGDTRTSDYLFVDAPTNDADRTPVFYAAGDVNEGATPNIQGIAYNNNIFGADATQQFGIDALNGAVVTVANNAGTLQTVGDLALDGLISNELAFDISGDTEIGYASIALDGGPTQLYTIDLTEGSTTFGNATLVANGGAIGGGPGVRDFTVIPAAVPEPSSAVILMVGLGTLCFRRKRSA